MTGTGRSNGKIIRKVHLPADRRSPATARAVVRSVLEQAGLSDLLDPSLLLTTELSTNAVVHAGTDLELEVIADPRGVTVTVIDNARGVLTPPEPITPDAAMLSERGRGLLLVDHFATRWGTTHYDTGKGVWFRLNRPNVSEPAETTRQLTELAATGATDTGPADLSAVTALLEITQDPYADDPVGEFATLLLARLVDLVGASGAVVRCDLGEGSGMTVLARYGRIPRLDEEPLRIPLALGGAASGELELDASATAYVLPLATLVAERLSLALENDRLRRADRRRRSWLTFLAEASELLAQSLDVELTLALIPHLVVPRLGRWSAVHTTDSWGRLRLAAAAHADEERLSHLSTALQETGPDSVLARLPGALRGGGQVPLPPPTEGFAVPLIARGQLLGTLSVGRHVERRHEPDEMAVLQDVARRAALALDNARIHAERRNAARTLQRSLLPPQLPKVPGLGLGAAYVPTGDAAEVGGDFYDVVALRDQWLIAIGDVSGKGVQAAAVTGLVREVIRALARGGRPLPEMLERINETLVERGGGRHCTLALASVTLHGQDHPAMGEPRVDVKLHLAGHEPPLLVRADGRTAPAGAGGTALGLLDTISCPAETVHLGPGDTLVFFTDGVTERRRGRELFGRQRLQEAAAPLVHYSAEVIAARLRATTIGFSPEPPRDDIALLVVRNEPVIPPTRSRDRTRVVPNKEKVA